ncbi:hypothetical protein N007_07590 [Alicyclobacillus acidoterrestris ATCC 49025]|nr:hypothetical protein N007_07590 [Alicyclobacillus acidoterrestris ATCC 49025]
MGERESRRISTLFAGMGDLPGRIVHVFCLICGIVGDSGHLGHEFYLMPGKSAEIGAQGGE